MAGSSSLYLEFQLPFWRPACELWPCLPSPTSAADCWRYPCVCLSVCLPICYTQINLHFLWWTLTDRSASALSSFNRCILSSY